MGNAVLINRYRSLCLSLCLLALGTTAPAQTVSGDFLAGQAAVRTFDFQSAASYFESAQALDPSKLQFKDSAMRAYLAMGDVDRAAQLSNELVAQDYINPTTDLVLTIHAFGEGRYDEALDRLGKSTIVSTPIDQLLEGWAHFGAGRVSVALETFDGLATQEGLRGFALSQKALAHALVGDFESADKIYSGAESGVALERTVHNVIARAQGLVQLGRKDEAVALLDEAFGQGRNPVVDDLQKRLSIGVEVEFDHIMNANDGIAELIYSLANALQSDGIDDVVLVYARLANFLSPRNVDAILLTAEVLVELGNHELATLAYDDVPRGHPSFISAEIGRATALRASGQTETAIEVLRQLAETNPTARRVHASLGDFLRRDNRYDDATAAYTASIDLIAEEAEADWYIYFVRGIAHERTDNWIKAEADFRTSIALSPNRHQVLNYLGYSMVEKQTNLDEALALIEKAAELQPDAGYIIDSLGWVLFRLGKYNDAVEHMEKAAELMATDPVVNDHLGDVYWAVGRKTEAEFQWRRAVSFISEDTDPNDIDLQRVQKKLSVGLDQVLADEGADPLKLVDGD